MSDFTAAAAALDPGNLPLERLMSKIVFTVLPASQRETPVRTGTLRRSETAVVEAAGTRGVVGTNVEYGPAVHARVPFFERGLAASRETIDQLLEAAGMAYLGGVSGAVQ